MAQLTAVLGPPPAPPAPPTLIVPQPLPRPSPKVPRAMLPATLQLSIDMLPPPPAPLTPTLQAQPQPPPTTKSSEEEMPEQEEFYIPAHTPALTPPAPCGKGKAKAPPLELTHRSTCISKPSHYLTRTAQGEGSTTGQSASTTQDEPPHTPSKAKCQWYHPNWPHSASCAYTTNASDTDFALIAESEELMKATANETGNNPKTLTEARS